MIDRQKPLLLQILDSSDIKIQCDYNAFRLSETLGYVSYLQDYLSAELDSFAISISLSVVHTDVQEAVQPLKSLIAL